MVVDFGGTTHIDGGPVGAPRSCALCHCALLELPSLLKTSAWSSPRCVFPGFSMSPCPFLVFLQSPLPLPTLKSGLTMGSLSGFLLLRSGRRPGQAHLPMSSAPPAPEHWYPPVCPCSADLSLGFKPSFRTVSSSCIHGCNPSSLL